MKLLLKAGYDMSSKL